jgi:hypothetical protein
MREQLVVPLLTAIWLRYRTLMDASTFVRNADEKNALRIEANKALQSYFDEIEKQDRVDWPVAI